MGDSTLYPEMQEYLNKVTEKLLTYQQLNVTLTGHSCDLGSEKINIEIGLKRANSVADYLKAKGVQRDRITVYSEGKNKPLYRNISEENRLKNRRVEIIFSSK